MNKSFISMLFSYLVWGSLPLYWKLLDGVSPLYILANRIFWCFIILLIMTLVQKRLPLIKEAIADKHALLWTVIASLAITICWGLFIWAVNSGFVLESSLGYYMNPLFTFILSAVVLKERFTTYDAVAIILAAAGVIYRTVAYGRFPYVAIILAITFAAYGLAKKKAALDATVSLTIETAIFAPFCLAYMVIASIGPASQLTTANAAEIIFLILSGAVTLAPLYLYSLGINGLPLIITGFLQYISPTLMLIIGVAVFGEPFDLPSIICFSLIWLGIAVFSAGRIMDARRQPVK
ncbi:MAG: EamA family transporter RarD [Christensenellales bacterium]